METQYLKADTGTAQTSDSSNVFSRELQVLGGGLVDGVKKTAEQTGANIASTASDLIHNPLGTAGDYLKNHWQDALAGAAIAVVAPEKWLNTALVAYSMRGVLGSTLRAGYMATDSSLNTDAVRNYYSESLAHEGTAMLSSLPATMAGGAFGKAGANAVFGKGKGLSDMLPYREEGQWIDPSVKAETIRENLSDVKYAVNPKPMRLLISDMDNTLLDFGTYEAMGVQEGIGNMAKRLNDLGHPIPEQELYKSIGDQMDKARSHDYPWSVELALKDRLKVGEPGGMPVDQFTREIVEPFWQSIDNARAEHMKLLPGVEETLNDPRVQGMHKVILSDAPFYAGLQRATAAGLDKHFDGIYALDNMKEPTGLSPELLAHGRQRIERILATPNEFEFTKAVPKTWEKPHNQSFNELRGRFGDENGPIDRHEAIMIGDSRTKDVQGAKESGMTAPWQPGTPANAVWAEFGNPPKNIEEILLRLRELPENQSAPGMPKVYPTPLEAAKDYSAILKYLDPKPNYGWLARQTVAIPPWQSALGFNPIPTSNDWKAFTASSNQLLSESPQDKSNK